VDKMKELRDMLKDAIDAAERAHRGYSLPAEEWYALRDAARALLEDNPGVGTPSCNHTSCNRGDHAGDCQRCMEVDRG
jgi:hypothetical protein